MDSDERDRRSSGDDVVIQVRVRRVNLPVLETGTELGIDAMTGLPIEVQLVKQPDGVYALRLVTNPYPPLSVPEAVDAERGTGRPRDV
jgi:hypothetical protein